MSESPQRDTRAEILAISRDLFGKHGYQRTSLREIAALLGVSKAAVLYHFPTKAEILAALAEPLLTGLEVALSNAQAAGPNPVAMRWAAIEGMLDTLLAQRDSLRMSVHDLALLSQETVFPRFAAAIGLANDLVAGPNPTATARIRAAQAIAMLSDPVMILPELPTETLRHEVLQGVRRLFTEPGSGLVQPRRRAGRPSRLSAEQLALARSLHEQGDHTGEEIAAAIGVSRATLYRHLSQ
ncbi:MAG TPA: TetR family transcriptional regulator [Pseudonocardiaceae bacterium]|jgi:AcrR family transcriptional regulator|nr:TetR family transcriptional regulator [Pseudonocardiaceae bacterium]